MEWPSRKGQTINYQIELLKIELKKGFRERAKQTLLRVRRNTKGITFLNGDTAMLANTA